MEDNKNNQSFDNNTFETPKVKNKTLCLRKTKSSYNTLKLDIEPSSTTKKHFNAKTHLALKTKFLIHHSSNQQFHTINSNKLINKTYDDTNKNNFKKERLSMQIEQNLSNNNSIDNEKTIKTDGNKKKVIKKENDGIKKMKIKKKVLDKNNDIKIKKDENVKNDNEKEGNKINKNKEEIKSIKKNNVKENIKQKNGNNNKNKAESIKNEINKIEIKNKIKK